jgi:hypothetical protein
MVPPTTLSNLRLIPLPADDTVLTHNESPVLAIPVKNYMKNFYGKATSNSVGPITKSFSS